MNLKELKEKIDNTIEELGETPPEDVEVNAHFDLDLEVVLTTPTGKVLTFKERTFEFESCQVQSIDYDGNTFTLMITEE